MAGVVVNDSLIMVDFINKAREAGVPLRQAILDSGTRRFRAIVLTSLTTIAGLLPILFGAGTGSEVMSRLAAPMVGGMVSTVLLTLLLLPVLYLLWRLNSCGKSRAPDN